MYVRSKQKGHDKVGSLEGSDGNVITEGFEYFSPEFTREDISSLPHLETEFEGRESDYLGQLSVTSKMVAKKIRDMKDNTFLLNREGLEDIMSHEQRSHVD